MNTESLSKKSKTTINLDETWLSFLFRHIKSLDVVTFQSHKRKRAKEINTNNFFQIHHKSEVSQQTIALKYKKTGDTDKSS